MKLFKPNENNEMIRIPAWVACLYFACMPLSIVPIPGDISLLKLISIFSGGALVLALFLGKNKNEIRFNVVHLFLGLYLIYSISSLFLLADENAWANLRGMIETTVLLFLISIRVYNEREKNALFNAWLIAGLITVITMFSGGIELGTTERLTIGIGGGSEDPNQLCGYFFVPLLVCMDRVMNKAKFKLLYVAFMVAMLYAAFTTGSRGGLVAIFATILVYVFMPGKGFGNQLKILVALIVVFVIFFTALFPLLPENVKERMSVESVVEDRGSGRFDLWEVVFDAITASETSLVFGYGLGSTTYFLQGSATRSTVAHNHWLQIWCDQGFIGLALFFAVIMCGAVRGFSKNKIITVSLFGMFVLSMSLTLYAGYKPFWNILMMSALNVEGVYHVAK